MDLNLLSICARDEARLAGARAELADKTGGRMEEPIVPSTIDSPCRKRGLR
jgi:hypothetical protein